MDSGKCGQKLPESLPTYSPSAPWLTANVDKCGQLICPRLALVPRGLQPIRAKKHRLEKYI